MLLISQTPLVGFAQDLYVECLKWIILFMSSLRAVI